MFVVDDDSSVRRSLARLVRGAGYRVEAFASAQEFLARPPRGGPCCLLLDVRMPGLTGLDLQETLAIAAHSVRRLHHRLPRRPGEREGHEGRGDRFSDQAGERRGSPGGDRAGGDQGQPARREEDRITEIRERIKTLTPREAEVFALVVTGMLNKQIAVELGVSEKMVKVHRGRVMEKMRAASLAELVRLADEGGVISAKS